MKLKLVFSIAIFFIIKIGKSQVNLQRGSFETSVPIYIFKDNLSNLSLNLTLNYSSGNGVVVDRYPSCIGEGWSLSGLGVVARSQKGTAPDDQKEQQGVYNDISKYPNGYMFNNNGINIGCPKLLSYFPLFSTQISNDRTYKEDNTTLADTEQDIFTFLFNGNYGSFVIDKNQQIHLQQDSKCKIEFSMDDQPQGIVRTLIKQFKITDPTGVQYIFNHRDNTNIFAYRPWFGDRNVNVANSLPISAKPFITNNWYLSEVIDPLSNREVTIQYKDDVIDVSTGTVFSSSIRENATIDNFNTGIIYGSLAENYPTHTTTITNLKEYSISPEVRRISLPNGDDINFSYETSFRKDRKGAFALNSIKINSQINQEEGQIEYLLQQKYFVKNELRLPVVGEEKHSRLALISVTKIIGNSQLKLFEYDYYLGENNKENFVPPVIFPAKDPWGYYNGDYCGVPINELLKDNLNFNIAQKVCLFEPPCSANYYRTYAQTLASFNSFEYSSNFGNPSSPYGEFSPSHYGLWNGKSMRSNVKSNYAKNGLIKTIKNIYGGITLVEYEQNKFEEDLDIYLTPNNNNLKPFSDKLSSVEENVVGGVHVANISTFEPENSIKTSSNRYKYINNDGSSSLWGVEFPANITKSISFFQPEDRRVTLSGCVYVERYAGIKNNFAFGNSSINSSKLQKILNALGPLIVNSIINKLFPSRALAAKLTFIIDFLGSCFGNENPPQVATYYTYTNSVLNFQNSLPAQFKRVEVISESSSQVNNGKVIYEFTSKFDNQLPIYIPYSFYPYTNKKRADNFLYGLPKSIQVFNANEKLIRSTTNEYTLVNNNTSNDLTKSCNCNPEISKSTNFNNYFNTATINEFSNVTIPENLLVEFYNQPNNGHVEILGTKETIYSPTDNNKYSEINKTFTYNPKNFLPATVSTNTSEGKILTEKYYYPEDYNLNNPSNSILKKMVIKNIVNTPISTELWQTNIDGTNQLIKLTATSFKELTLGQFRPEKTYSLISNKPIDPANIGEFDPEVLVRNNSLILPTSTTAYDNIGNISDIKNNLTNTNACLIFGYNHQFPIATTKNANSSEVAYISFEEGGGDWNIIGGEIISDDVPMGKKCLNGSFQIQSPVIGNSKESKLTFWTTSTNVTVGSLTPTNVTATINGWTLKEYIIPAGFTYPITIAGNGKIDEIRIHPFNAKMNTIAYNIMYGKISEADENNRMQYYEYDSLGRLIIIRDENKDIIKTYEYHYKNQ